MKTNNYLVPEEQLRRLVRSDLIIQALRESYIKANWSKNYNLKSIEAVYYDAIDDFFVDPRDERGDYEAAIDEWVDREMKLYAEAPDVRLP